MLRDLHVQEGRGNQWTTLSLGLLVCVVLAPVISQNSCGVTFVLLGSTGSLARLYLWPALFKYHSFTLLRQNQCKLIIFGASRQSFTDKQEILKNITSEISCEGVDVCAETLSHFRRATHFIQTRSHEDYTLLQQQIQQVYFDRGLKEIGRVFYLAITPSSYQKVLQNIHQYARPEAGAWLRVVLEKPFGNDLTSSELLASEISEYLSKEEIYLVDHYLGKFGVQQILPFRLQNSALLSPAWNKDSVQFVEVVMKERLDVKGRSKFYNSYGVIRDVFQNHLTEILVRLLVPTHTVGERSFTAEHFIASKKKVLSKLYPPMLRHSLLGQYIHYHKHLQEDGVFQQLGNINSSRSLTPTFASVALYVRDPLWQGVPFILLSGKQLDQRTAYARVVFKQRSFDVGKTSSNSSLCTPEVIFLIHDEQFWSPGVLISEQLSSMEFTYPTNIQSTQWTHEITTYSKGSGVVCKYSYIHPSGAVESNAYVSVIKAVLEGKQEHFVDTDSLLLSWQVWSPLLDEIELTKHSLNLRPYSPNLLDVLKFELKGTNMVPSNGASSIIDMNHEETVSHIGATGFVNNVSTLWSRLIGQRTTVAHKYALSILVAEDLLRAAQVSIKQRGEFHLALPGGQSTTLLLNLLSLDYYASFPWQQTHIWQTDERCVKQISGDSNWRQILEYFLSVVPIPFHHLHPMPIDLQNGICNDADKGTFLYHRYLSEFLSEYKLDYVVLGVGADGHVTSLFPEAAEVSTSISKDFATIVELKESYNVHVKKRMTLSYDTILNARSIAVIVAGAHKQNLLDRVAECLKFEDLCDIPLVKLIRSASLGQLSLHVDSEIV